MFKTSGRPARSESEFQLLRDSVIATEKIEKLRRAQRAASGGKDDILRIGIEFFNAGKDAEVYTATLSLPGLTAESLIGAIENHVSALRLVHGNFDSSAA